MGCSPEQRSKHGSPALAGGFPIHRTAREVSLARFLAEEVVWQWRFCMWRYLRTGLLQNYTHRFSFSLLLPALSILGKSGTRKNLPSSLNCRIIHWGRKWRTRKTSKPWGQTESGSSSRVRWRLWEQLISRGLREVQESSSWRVDPLEWYLTFSFWVE